MKFWGWKKIGRDEKITQFLTCKISATDDEVFL